jgi:hypothetical protein
MSENKWTQGEWRIVPARHDSFEIEHPNDRGTTDLLFTVHDLNRTDRDDEVKANAHILLAARDMYAVLEKLLEDYLDVAPSLIEEANAALAKARGES